MNTSITLENWTYCHYKSLQLKAFISLGGEPGKSIELRYLVTLTDHENQELYQTSHSELEDALLDLNSRYQHWDLVDAEQGSQGEGCSSCHAH